MSSNFDGDFGFRVRLSVEDATINRLSTFTVDRARLSLIGPMIAVNISVPTIYVDGYYNISGKVGNVFPVYGAGAFQAMVYDFRIYVNTVLGYSRGMYMKSFDLDFSLETVDMALENFMGGDEVGRIMTEVNIADICKNHYFKYLFLSFFY